MSGRLSDLVIRTGDTVHVRGRAGALASGHRFALLIAGACDAHGAYWTEPVFVPYTEIVMHKAAPRPLQVGDEVSPLGANFGGLVIKAIDGPSAWCLWPAGDYSTFLLAELARP